MGERAEQHHAVAGVIAEQPEAPRLLVVAVDTELRYAFAQACVARRQFELPALRGAPWHDSEIPFQRGMVAPKKRRECLEQALELRHAPQRKAAVLLTLPADRDGVF